MSQVTHIIWNHRLLYISLVRVTWCCSVKEVWSWLQCDVLYLIYGVWPFILKTVPVHLCVLSFQSFPPVWQDQSQLCACPRETICFLLVMNPVCWKYGSTTLWSARSRWKHAQEKRIYTGHTCVFVFVLITRRVCLFASGFRRQRPSDLLHAWWPVCCQLHKARYWCVEAGVESTTQLCKVNNCKTVTLLTYQYWTYTTF